ncbi:hypothetical protein [Azospirillum sp. TSO22-1]|uniref:hypothetical protein n=1 Tax=Azospirillum sp. TSO22-1 TaxID=716789 RepID=UPI000D620EFE|nr:hypothetical protein [Azospirillum sp. TSO22-1]PWC53611.1 hypothetical protein TSO221_10305 [Azospirillum sp. TSO22-1]
MLRDDLTDLRRRLEAERDALLDEMTAGDHLAPGLLNLLTGVHVALSALGATQLEVAEPLAARVRVRDIDGEPLSLVAYLQDGASIAVEVPALRALALAEDLTAAARRRLVEQAHVAP